MRKQYRLRFVLYNTTLGHPKKKYTHTQTHKQINLITCENCDKKQGLLRERKTNKLKIVLITKLRINGSFTTEKNTKRKPVFGETLLTPFHYYYFVWFVDCISFGSYLFIY